ncbi:RGS domain-containing protein [Pilaira anomala]|nr:RGS domain-containing protein [Pilaira anomala]
MTSTESIVLSLESVLEDRESELFKDFATFLHQSYCIENLGFWIATREYEQECDEKRKSLCQAMIQLYIRPNSTQEINIPCDMRQSILDDYNSENYHLNLFDDAAEAVLELMRVNSFLPWTSSSFDLASNSSSASSTYSSSDAAMATNIKNNHHKSWPPLSKKLIPLSNSLHGLSTSFSFSKKFKQNRKSCSHLDYIQHQPHHLQNDSIHNIFSVSSATSTITTTSGTTRYKSMLKRVKNSLLGNHPLQLDTSSTITTSTTSWSSWKKSLR